MTTVPNSRSPRPVEPPTHETPNGCPVTNTITIDVDAGSLVHTTDAGTETHPLGGAEAFAILSRAWLRSGWQNKYVYSFTWFGRPIIQLPDDLVRLQEALYVLQPDVVIETGIAHGGSLIFYASLLKAMGRGRVIGVDIEIRPPNRAALETHELFDLVTLIEGDSIATDVVDAVRSRIAPDEKVFVMLDGNHTRDHVLAELESYAPLVSVGSYIVAADGIMADLAGLRRHEDQRPNDDWDWNNPCAAVDEFVKRHEGFVVEAPPFLFNEGTISDPVTYSPAGWVKRVS